MTYDYTSTRRSAMTYPNDRQLDYAYHDFGGPLETLSDNGPSEIVRYEYIGGRTLKREMANGVDLDMRDGAGGTLYDALGRPTEWKHLDSNQNVVIGFSYGYDRVGNKRWQRVLHDTRDSQRYAYDSASRLTAFVRGDFGPTEQDWCDASSTQPRAGMTQARQWTLDGVGNWDHVETKTDGNTVPESRTDTTFNEYSAIGGVAQAHDANGNLTDDGTYEYAWDGLNRLVSVSDGATHATIVTYAYDPGNRRMLLDEATAFTSDTLYCYAGWRVVEERVASGGALQRQFVYGNYIDEPLVMNVNGDANSSCLDAGTDPAYYYLQNTLYSVYALTDASGVVVEAYSYDPYGNHTLHLDGPDAGSSVDFSSDDLRFEKGRSPHLNPYGFTGRRFDRETGMWYYRNRYYSAERGRFVSRDPIGYRGGVDLYAYLVNTPLNGTDAYGLDSYFAIYYSGDRNRAFERAADTWIRELKASSDYSPKCDAVFKVGVATRNDFTTAWDGIDKKVKARKGTVAGDEWKVKTGKIYGHGAPGVLSFQRDDPNTPGSGIINSSRVKKLQRLDWRDDGELYIHACNSAVSPWGTGVASTAVQFAFAQEMIVFGLPGVGMFSSVAPPQNFKSIELFGGVFGRAKDVYLASYYRTDNVEQSENDPADGRYMPLRRWDFRRTPPVDTTP